MLIIPSFPTRYYRFTTSPRVKEWNEFDTNSYDKNDIDRSQFEAPKFRTHIAQLGKMGLSSFAKISARSFPFPTLRLSITIATTSSLVFIICAVKTLVEVTSIRWRRWISPSPRVTSSISMTHCNDTWVDGQISQLAAEFVAYRYKLQPTKQRQRPTFRHCHNLFVDVRWSVKRQIILGQKSCRSHSLAKRIKAVLHFTCTDYLQYCRPQK